jgi:hypothetical protein
MARAGGALARNARRGSRVPRDDVPTAARLRCYDTGVRPPRLPIFALLLLATAPLEAGCLHEDMTAEAEPDWDRWGEPAEATVVREVVVESEESTAAPVAYLPASPRDRPSPDPVPFRLGAGRGALGRVDLAACREQGLPLGYLHVRVTFRRTGRVVHAAVESPEAPTPEALSCIGEQLEATLVPAFDGGDVTLSKSFFVN